MISNLVSFFISSRLQREPIYDALAYQDGIHLPSAATRQQRGGRQVASLMKPATDALPTSITVSEALNLSLASQYDCWPICDKRGIVGVISKRKLERVAHEDREVKLVGDLVDGRAFPHLHADQSLHMALERMGEAGLDLLPVVSRADVHVLEGIALLRDVLESYRIGEDKN